MHVFVRTEIILLFSVYIQDFPNSNVYVHVCFHPATTVSVSVQHTNVPSQLLDLPSYNGFSLTCTATSRASTQDVALTKVITWMRSVDGGSAEVLTDPSTANDVTMISHMDLGQPTATSELMVNTTLSGSHVYTCSVSVPVSPATDVIQGDDSTTIMVQG